MVTENDILIFKYNGKWIIKNYLSIKKLSKNTYKKKESAIKNGRKLLVNERQNLFILNENGIVISHESL